MKMNKNLLFFIINNNYFYPKSEKQKQNNSIFIYSKLYIKKMKIRKNFPSTKNYFKVLII